MVKRTPTGAFEALSLVRGEDGRYEGILFDVGSSLEYFVEADNVRSAVYKLTIVDVPYVERLEIEYHFPAYTGLEPQKIEDGGDIAVLKGTEVRLRVFPTMKTGAGRVALNDKDSAALTAQADGSLTAAFTANADGFYRIELDAPSGERTAASPQYTIDVLTDQAPSVSFAKPGRDTSASCDRGGVRRGAGGGRLRRPRPRAGVLGEWRSREDREAVRRSQSPARGHRGTHLLSRGTGRRAGRRSVGTTRVPSTIRAGRTNRPRATCISCASVRSAATSARPSLEPVAEAGAAGAAAVRWKRCRNSSARSSRRPSTSSAIAGRTRQRSCARAPRSLDCRSRASANRSRACSRG